MRRALLIQHEAYEGLGTLDPLLKKEGVRIRYVNFERTPDAQPSLENQDALILAGGYMGVYENDRYFHLNTEMKLVEEALQKKLPILGICLGSQILAHVLGSHVRQHSEREMGWYELSLTEAGRKDPVLGPFGASQYVFQSHGDTFDIPKSAEHLATSAICPAQAFRYGETVYGIQFHLEADATIIQDWLKMPENEAIFAADPKRFSPERIQNDTQKHLARSLALSQETFLRWIRAAGRAERPLLLGSGHKD